MPPAIRVENLGKSYRIGRSVSGAGYRTLRESLVDLAWSPLRRIRGDHAPRDEEFWALEGVGFEVQPGEVVGIIGRNGAGKSTLLKILSRITRPTTGRVELRGRVGSLLEVGTGFHPELTGRENVFLNGSILGMRRAEIARKFDEIVAFAEVERFLDTPVKRYSSGMYVRLAFAVAASLNSEILLVDEVLAVGDVAFQEKCTTRIAEVSRSGRTIFFVSHNMASLLNLCHKAIWLDAGRIIDVGPAAEQVSRYLSSLRRRSGTPVGMRTDRSGSGELRLSEVSLRDGSGRLVDRVQCGDRVTIELAFRGARADVDVVAHLAIYDESGHAATFMSSEYTCESLRVSDTKRISCRVTDLALTPGRYLINFCLTGDGRELDHIAGAAEFEVLPGFFFESGRTPPASHGRFLCRHSWGVI